MQPQQHSTQIEPEFVDAPGAFKMFALRRGHLYNLTQQGRIASVSFRERGKTKGRRLWEVSSIREYLRTLQSKGVE